MKKLMSNLICLAGGIALVFGLAAVALTVLTGCTRIEYVDRPTEVPTAVVTPTAVITSCVSVPRSRGDCHETQRDVYLAEYTAATDAAALSSVMWKDEITNGPAYLAFIMEHLRSKGLCAEIYQHEEIAVWSKQDQTFSENWDAIREPAGGGIFPRLGAGAHEWTCNPATTEAGS